MGVKRARNTTGSYNIVRYTEHNKYKYRVGAAIAYVETPLLYNRDGCDGIVFNNASSWDIGAVLSLFCNNLYHYSIKKAFLY